MSEELIDLSQFTGTSQYYRHFLPNCVFTDGVKALAESRECYWLVDVCFSHLTNKKVRAEEFIVCRLKVENEKAEFQMDDGDKGDGPVVLARQHINYTDFPEPECTLYLQNDGEHWVLMLTSEY